MIWLKSLWFCIYWPFLRLSKPFTRTVYEDKPVPGRWKRAFDKEGDEQALTTVHLRCPELFAWVEMAMGEAEVQLMQLGYDESSDRNRLVLQATIKAYNNILSIPETAMKSINDKEEFNKPLTLNNLGQEEKQNA